MSCPGVRIIASRRAQVGDLASLHLAGLPSMSAVRYDTPEFEICNRPALAGVNEKIQ